MQLEGPPLYEPIAVVEDPIAAKKAGIKVPPLVAGWEWLKWLSGLTTRIDEVPVRKATVNLTAQQASIGTTALPMGTVEPGLYRISYYLRITTPATVSSSVTFTLSWMDGTIAMTTSGAAVTGNLTTTHQLGTLPVRSDANQPISYSTVYASVGAQAMQYSLHLVIEQLKAEAV